MFSSVLLFVFCFYVLWAAVGGRAFIGGPLSPREGVVSSSPDLWVRCMVVRRVLCICGWYGSSCFYTPAYNYTSGGWQHIPAAGATMPLATCVGGLQLLSTARRDLNRSPFSSWPATTWRSLRFPVPLGQYIWAVRAPAPVPVGLNPPVIFYMSTPFYPYIYCCLFPSVLPYRLRELYVVCP